MRDFLAVGQEGSIELIGAYTLAQYLTIFLMLKREQNISRTGTLQHAPANFSFLYPFCCCSELKLYSIPVTKQPNVPNSNATEFFRVREKMQVFMQVCSLKITGFAQEKVLSQPILWRNYQGKSQQNWVWVRSSYTAVQIVWTHLWIIACNSFCMLYWIAPQSWRVLMLKMESCSPRFV